MDYTKKKLEPIISLLITENYLNEERFAINYAGGKFRINQWGKNQNKTSPKIEAGK